MQRPFLKWAGGKFQIAQRVIDALPKGRRLIEPFVGSGVVFLNTEYDQYFLADNNADLINVYNSLAQLGVAFIDLVSELFQHSNNTETRFYAFREEFNSRSSDARKAALFIYLNRHCYNGLCRYNKSGGFNTPFGRYEAPYFPKAELLAFLSKAERATFAVCGFEETFRIAREDDVFYCDPPYVPLTATANFTSYSPGFFGAAAQTELARLAELTANKGIPVLLSNHDTPFVRQLYQAAQIRFFSVQRFISAKTAKRDRAPEVLALYGADFSDVGSQSELWDSLAKTPG